MLLLSLTLVQASVACMLTGLLLWGLLSQAARHGLRWRRSAVSGSVRNWCWPPPLYCPCCQRRNN